MTTPLTPAEIANMEALLAAATEGEWANFNHYEPERNELSHEVHVPSPRTQGRYVILSGNQNYYDVAVRDASFAAAAHNLMPRLIADWKRMRDFQQRVMTQGLFHLRRKNRTSPNWKLVNQLTGHGSGFSYALCREFNIDPDATEYAALNPPSDERIGR